MPRQVDGGGGEPGVVETTGRREEGDVENVDRADAPARRRGERGNRHAEQTRETREGGGGHRNGEDDWEGFRVRTDHWHWSVERERARGARAGRRRSEASDA